MGTWLNQLNLFLDLSLDFAWMIMSEERCFLDSCLYYKLDDEILMYNSDS